MNVFVICIGDISKTPPAINVIQALNKKGHHVTLIGNKLHDGRTKQKLDSISNLTTVEIAGEFHPDIPIFYKFIDSYFVSRKIQKYLDEHVGDEPIWIISSTTVRYLGKYILKRNYILHLLELTEEIYWWESKHMFPMSREYAKNAKVVVECEYNRAHITKAWWNLDDLPIVLPNKPYSENEFRRKMSFTSDNVARLFDEKLKGKKIILYQGNISKERPLDGFLNAVKELGSPYIFVAMTNGDDPYPSIKEDYYLHIPFIEPPFHLEVTSHAYIGIVAYTAIRNNHSILNTLYCAPNKIWEYSQFGIPIIGNDLPALKSMFEKYHNGVCVDQIKKEDIVDAVRMIEKDYSNYCKNSLVFNDSIDLSDRVEEIINKVIEKRER